MIKGFINNKHVRVTVNGTAEELAREVLRLTKAIYDSIVEEDGPLKLNAMSFRHEIVANIDYLMRKKEE